MKDGRPAFPQAWHPDMNCHPSEAPAGISLRDYFMAHAPITVADAIQCCGFAEGDGLGRDAERATTFAVLALMRREYADAMLAERDK